MYAEYDYYLNSYLMNAPPVVPEELYFYWEKKACREVDNWTFKRLHGHREFVTDDVKNCVCELAEFMYQAHSILEQAAKNNGAGLLVSYNNDGQSGSFDISESPYTETGQKKKIREIIRSNLADTGLLFTGVNV